MYRFVDLCVASLGRTNSVNYIFRENSHKMNDEPTCQLRSRYLACHIINMPRNCRKNSCRSGSTPPMNPAPLLPAFANLLTKGRIKYGLTGLVRVRVRVSINIILFVTFYRSIFISLDGATVVSTDPWIALRDRSMVARSTDASANKRSIDRSA